MTRKHNPTYVKRGPNSLKELVQQRSDLAEQGSIWDDLTQLQVQCTQLNQSPSQVVALLRNRELVAQIKDQASLLQLANTLNRDIQDFSNRLVQLNQSAEQYRNQPLGPQVLGVLMDLAQAYDQWITSYQLVVVPTAIQITDLFNQINQAPQV